MPLGVVFALGAYALYSCCDAIIKGFGVNLPVYEIAFFSSLFSLLPAIFTKPKGEHWRQFHKAKHPWLLHARSVAGLIGNFCVIYAFVHIPLADTYSIVFLAPIFIVILSIFFLGETLSWQRGVFLALTFVGVLLVVRPGFRDLQLGHLLALMAALTGAVSTTVLRHVAPHEKRVSLIGMPLGYILLVNGIAMVPTFVLPTLEQLAFFLVIGGLGGTANLLFIHATRIAKASEIAPGQYSQIAWAIVLGAVFYHEFPDTLGYCGLAVVAAFGILNVISDETRIRIFSRLSPTGIGPATAAAEVAPVLPDEPGQPQAREKTDA